MIKPSIGRVVHYRPLEEDRDDIRHAAIITTVHTDDCVNLTVFDSVGVPYHRQSVVLIQDGEILPNAGECEWMPYQHGQKVEEVALEAATAIDDFMEQTADRINLLNERIMELESYIDVLKTAKVEVMTNKKPKPKTKDPIKDNSI